MLIYIIGLIIIVIIFFKIDKKIKERKKIREELRRQEEELRRQEEEQINLEKKYEEAMNIVHIAYQEALRGSDKIDALTKGRFYYSLIQFGADALKKDYTNQLSRKYIEQLKLDIYSMNV